MSKSYYYERKLRILKEFNTLIKNGSTFDVAVDQCRSNNGYKNRLEEILVPIVIATRFFDMDKPIQFDFRNNLEVMIDKFESLDLEQFGLDENEIDDLSSEVKKIKRFVSTQ